MLSKNSSGVLYCTARAPLPLPPRSALSPSMADQISLVIDETAAISVIQTRFKEAYVYVLCVQWTLAVLEDQAGRSLYCWGYPSSSQRCVSSQVVTILLRTDSEKLEHGGYWGALLIIFGVTALENLCRYRSPQVNEAPTTALP